MNDAVPFYIAGALLVLTWVLNRFVESLLKNELETWTAELLPLHERKDRNAPVDIRPISDALNENLLPDVLMLRIGRNNDCVAIVISALSLVFSTVLLSEDLAQSLVPLICVVLAFVGSGAVYLLRPVVYKYFSFHGFSFSNLILAIANLVIGASIGLGVWAP